MWDPDRMSINQLAEGIKIAVATMTLPVILAIARFRLAQLNIAGVAFYDASLNDFSLIRQFHEAPCGYRSHMLYPFSACYQISSKLFAHSEVCVLEREFVILTKNDEISNKNCDPHRKKRLP